MKRYVLRRILMTIPVLFGVTLAVFSMLHLLPVDPVQMMIMDATSGAAPTSLVTQEMMDNLRHELGLDKPIHIQFITYVWNAAHGDLGRSFQNKRPISEMLIEQLPYTIRLGLSGMAFAIVFGMGMGVLAGLKPNSWIDNVSMTLAMFGISMPSFWLGLMLIYLLALQFRILPALGFGSVKTLILPAVTLGFQASAIIARLTRSSIVEVMHSDYIRTARAKGLSERVVVIIHALRNALIPVVTIIGLQFGGLMSGAVVVETVFGRPGVGRLGVDAILSKDFPLVQGFVLLVATIYVVTNLVIDLSYAMLDPRIRFQ